MSLASWSIERPVGVTLLTLGLILAGILGYWMLPVSPLPQVDFPTISVQASLPGADPETMATSVAAPLERQFARIAGVSEMTSTSSRGSASINLQFDLSRNIDGAARDVQAAINAARSFLPSSMPSNPTYRKMNPADAPILLISLTSDVTPVPKMYDIASTILAQKLSQVKGVGQVVTGGGSTPAVRVSLNPAALSQYGISLEKVRSMLSTTNVNRPLGQIDTGERTMLIEANDQLHKAADYEPLLVSYKNGAAVRLMDVGSVQDGVEDARTLGLMNGTPSVMLIIFRQPGANIIETVDNLRALLPQLQASLPGDVSLSVVVDRTPPIRGALREVERALVISCALVILVVFAFLRSGRATLIPAAAVVSSLIGTFAAMYLLDYSLDNLSLMALTVATGFVVDDAIVVLENVARRIEAGEQPKLAALAGAKEISFTVVSMSFSLVAVFIPILLMQGATGRMFREFAVTLSASVLISMVLSLTLTPMMCATLLKPHSSTPGRISRLAERFFTGMERLYARSLDWALREQPFMLFLTFAAAACAVLLYAYIPKGFFPQQDIGRLMGAIQAAQDESFQSMSGKLERVIDIIKSDPDVLYAAGYTGGGGGPHGGQTSARMFITLKPFEQRTGNAEDLLKRLRKKLATVPDAPTFLMLVQELRLGGRSSNALYQYTLQSDEFGQLNLWAPRMLDKMRAMPQIVDVNSDQQDKGLQTKLVIDRATASRLGVSPKTIDNTLYDAFGQRQVSVSYENLNQYRVVMELAPQFLINPVSLRDVFIPTGQGKLAPLAAFTRVETTNTTLSVNHQGQFPSITISFNLSAGVSLGQAVPAIEQAARDIGLPANVRGTFMGTAQAFQASVGNQQLLILAALITVYIVLGILYESYVHPLTILSTLPSAGVGAVLALLLSGSDLNVLGLIGMILLIGIVKKNGIMMVDFALVAEREHKLPPLEAIREACVLRFRPIMMTTLAAMLGALPLALGTGVGSELRRPLGVAIVGGLIISQALTLFTTPVVYLYLDRLRRWRSGDPKQDVALSPSSPRA
jgi:multidrug efflux pump